MKEIYLDAITDNLKPLFNFISEELASYGCSPKDVRQVRLCVEEIFVNIANYSYHPETGEARITLDVSDHDPNSACVVLQFFDSGRPFNPLDETPPDLERSLEEAPIGGLGIHIVKSKMDNVDYEYRDGQNILTIKKAMQKAV